MLFRSEEHGGDRHAAAMALEKYADVGQTALEAWLASHPARRRYVQSLAEKLIAREVMGGFPTVIGYGLFKLLSSIRLTNGAPSLNGMDPPAKMLWLKRHEPKVYGAAWKLLDVKDWLLLRATGHAATTADLANVTWMMDTRKGREGWSDALIARFGLKRALLPDIVDGTASPGGLTAAAASELGLPSGLPVFAGAGDVCAAEIGRAHV